MKYKKISFLAFFLLTNCFHSDNDIYTPKPRGFFRIDLPEKNYRIFDTILPFKFEYPEYSDIYFRTDKKDVNGYWFDLYFQIFNGSVHFSYKKLSNDLTAYTEDTRNFVFQHIAKADDICFKLIDEPEKRVFAMLYYIEGEQAASPLQFYVTDSINHFIRGALYFEHIPNNDSISPIIDFVNKDILHFIETVEWK